MADQMELFSKKPPWTVNGPRILVRRDEAEEKSPGGIVLPATSAQAERPYRGTVLAIGNGLNETQRSAVVVKCSVHYSRFGGVEVSLKEFHPEGKMETLVLLHIDEILLVKKD